MPSGGFWQMTGGSLAEGQLLAGDRCLLVASGFLIKVFSFQSGAGGRWLLADRLVELLPTPSHGSHAPKAF